MKPHHGLRRMFGENNGRGAAKDSVPAGGSGGHARRPAGGTLICEGLGKIEAPKPAEALLAHGLDSLYVGYYFEFVNSLIDWEALAFRREQLRQRRFGAGEELTLGTESFWFLPYGKKPYSYVLSNKDFELRLAEHLQPCCYVQFFSEALWRDGAHALHLRFLRWAGSQGLTVSRKNVVSRADWAFDFHIPAIDFDVENIVSRGRLKGRWADGEAVTGFQIGKGDLVVRLYDKVAEIAAQSDKVWMFQVWGRNTEVWRIEFQARKEVLKEHGIGTVNSLLDLQYDLLREITEGHTTLRTPNGDLNRSRWPLHPLWRSLRAAIAAHPQEGLVRSICSKSTLLWRRREHAKYLYGALKGLGALDALTLGNGTVPDLNETLKSLRLLIVDREYDPAIWQADIEDRVRRHGLGKW